ncbi:hypothetical protein [Enterovibrio nigricans]|uniref:Uncharacterized protein n=1 Tax=Enterovibrio nigricans DSM 22720 TaxID=1121868 RepID=A0A1T4WH87_9GAMM|nr:hypothetical protein [Enterovibrio nigricans]PKF48640.1 hypothetical protein AT251_24605 [Enterovibrio nigricans]SKA76694.1 hypothetical protein SAMN02745132_04937 [Enterovibrio nigricans DSM 22720]
MSWVIKLNHINWKDGAKYVCQMSKDVKTISMVTELEQAKHYKRYANIQRFLDAKKHSGFEFEIIEIKA